MKTFFGLIYSKEVNEEVLIQAKLNLFEELDFLTIYGKLSLKEAYLVPSVRRRIFLENLKKFKAEENRHIEESQSQNKNANFNKMSFQ